MSKCIMYPRSLPYLTALKFFYKLKNPMYNLGEKVVDKLMKLSKKDCLWDVLQLIFYKILPESKFSFWVVGYILTTKSNHFRDFLLISCFPKILNLRQLVRQLKHPISGDKI